MSFINTKLLLFCLLHMFAYREPVQVEQQDLGLELLNEEACEAPELERVPRVWEASLKPGKLTSIRYGLPTDLRRLLKDVEREVIQGALDATEGNQGKAAERLGLKRGALVMRLRRLDGKA